MSDLFSLEAFYAGKGDALILHFGTKDEPRWILIDGGHHHVYDDWLAPRLRALRSAHIDKVDDRGRLPFDLAMVSHADEDHVKGLLELFRHIDAGAVTREAPAIAIEEMWFNAFDELLAPDGDGQVRAQSVLRAASTGSGSVTLPASVRGSHEVAAVLASTKQGVELRDLARKLRIPRNRLFGGGLVCRDGDYPSRTLRPVKGPPDFSMTILGPDQARVDDARKRWKADLAEKKNEKKGDVELNSFDDDSPHNLASIMVLIEQSGKSMLLTGDGRGDHLYKGLESQGLLDDDGRIHVDLFKLPHHGSDNNTEQSTFEKITADHYVVSANGEHDNPMTQTLEMLENGRATAGLRTPYRIYFTFPESAFNLFTEKQLEKSAKTRKRKAALEKLDTWTRSPDRPDNCQFVYRHDEDFSVTVRLLESTDALQTIESPVS